MRTSLYRLFSGSALVAGFADTDCQIEMDTSQGLCKKIILIINNLYFFAEKFSLPAGRLKTNEFFAVQVKTNFSCPALTMNADLLPVIKRVNLSSQIKYRVDFLPAWRLMEFSRQKYLPSPSHVGSPMSGICR